FASGRSDGAHGLNGGVCEALSCACCWVMVTSHDDDAPLRVAIWRRPLRRRPGALPAVSFPERHVRDAVSQVERTVRPALVWVLARRDRWCVLKTSDDSLAASSAACCCSHTSTALRSVLTSFAPIAVDERCAADVDERQDRQRHVAVEADANFDAWTTRR